METEQGAWLDDLNGLKDPALVAEGSHLLYRKISTTGGLGRPSPFRWGPCQLVELLFSNLRSF